MDWFRVGCQYQTHQISLDRLLGRAEHVRHRGRRFDARISTEFAIPLTDSACVYRGACIAVCPTNAPMFKSEYDMRQAGAWDKAKQTVATTACPYCGVGCNTEIHVQDDRIVKATSPMDHDDTNGNLFIKGRFGWEFVNNRPMISDN